MKKCTYLPAGFCSLHLIRVCVFCCFLLTATGLSQAQNLVPNPSFEEMVGCPNGAGQINLAVGWVAIRNSPDYFNSCSPSLDYSVPSNSFGFQNPLDISCSAYGGLFTYTYPVQFAREYLGVHLDSALIVNKRYFVSFKAVRASGQSSATNNIGILFTTRQLQEEPMYPLKNFSHINNESVITDTLNWTTVSGSFIADSSYTFIAMGNFYDDSTTAVVGNYGLAYYFIDDICVSADSLSCADYTYRCMVGMVENSDSHFGLYPNPVSNFLKLVLPDNAELIVSDILGHKVYHFISDKKIETINVSNFSNGLYFLKMKIGNKSIVKKILIQKKFFTPNTVFAPNLSSGTYSYTLLIDGKAVETKRMVKAK